jgi:hypothetical protein
MTETEGSHDGNGRVSRLHLRDLIGGLMTDSEGSHDETLRVCLVTETGSHDGNSGNSMRWFHIGSAGFP